MLDCQEALFNPNCMTKVLLEDIKKRCRRDREGLSRFSASLFVCLFVDPVSCPFYQGVCSVLNVVLFVSQRLLTCLTKREILKTFWSTKVNMQRIYSRLGTRSFSLKLTVSVAGLNLFPVLKFTLRLYSEIV